jgi:hypothetical protein
VLSAADAARAIDPRRVTEAQLDALVEAATEARALGLWLRAPAVIDLGREAHIPLVALATYFTNAPLAVERVGALVVTRLETHETLAALWTEWKESDDTRAPAAPDPDALVGFVAHPLEVDLRDRLADLAWRPGHLVVRAIVGDTVSAPVSVELSAGAVARDPDVRAYLDQMAAQQPPRPAPPPSPIAMSYQHDEASVPVPAQPGVALAMQKVSLARRGDSLVLRGAYNLPVAPHERIAADAPGSRDGEGRRVVARVTLTLVLVGHTWPGPFVIPLHLDARAFADVTSNDDRVAGLFRCDLFAHPAMPRMLQRYSVYAFAAEHMAGPLPLSLVDDRLVPPR